MKDVLLLVDLFNDFRHDDGERLLRSFLGTVGPLGTLLENARAAGTPVVFANDSSGAFDGNSGAIVERARAGPAGEHIETLAPRPGDRFVVKPRYSAFDLTPLELLLRDLEVERVLLAGMTMEACVAQTAIAARERGFRVTVVPEACATIDPELAGIALAYLERVVGTWTSPVSSLRA